jgi:hypothetical protein
MLLFGQKSFHEVEPANFASVVRDILCSGFYVSSQSLQYVLENENTNESDSTEATRTALDRRQGSDSL